MIRLHFRAKTEKHYGQEVQKLYQTSSFRMDFSNKGNVDQEFLEMIITIAKEKTLLLISLV